MHSLVIVEMIVVLPVAIVAGYYAGAFRESRRLAIELLMNCYERKLPPPGVNVPTRYLNFSGNSHQRRVARRQFERANKLGQA